MNTFEQYPQSVQLGKKSIALAITLAVQGVLKQIDLGLKLVLELYLDGISSEIFSLVSAVFGNLRNWSC